MTRNILVFGDSNSHGTPPIVNRGRYERYARKVRWPGVMAEALGEDYCVVEEALPGRTAQFDDPVMGPHMNGRPGLRMALQSHGPLDLLIIMLGTNDAKKRFAASAEMITAGIAGLVDIAMSDEYQLRHHHFDVLVICPPPVKEAGLLASEFIDGPAVGEALAPMLEAYCARRGVAYLDAGTLIATSEVDGVHLTPESHRTLGLAVAEKLRTL